MKQRCDWGQTSELMTRYHDVEWGLPVYGDRKLFEFLVLEGMQAGLSWLTVLRKRENYRKVFDQFNPEKIARYGKAKINRLLQDKGIIRNRLKVESAVSNARIFLAVQKEFGSFSRYVWAFVGGKPIRYARKRMKELPATTPESDAMSKELKARGFRFVGSTICYAHMQATGMVNDHLTTCFRYKQVQRAAQKINP